MDTRLTVAEPVASLHSRPLESADVVSQAIFGTNVILLVRDWDWLRVRTPDGYRGWIRRSSARSSPSGVYAAGLAVAEVRTLLAQLYMQPDVTTSPPLMGLPFESRLEVTMEPPEQDRRWLRVRLPDARQAWIQRGDAALAPVRLSPGELPAFARGFLGIPYVWGGVSTLGFDCSGFTQMLCRQRGILIPRDSGPQARWAGMAPINPPELQVADLVYFGPSADKINHTGMYIGSGEFIHATTHEKPVVQVSRLSDPHWARLLVACRRPREELKS